MVDEEKTLAQLGDRWKDVKIADIRVKPDEIIAAREELGAPALEIRKPRDDEFIRIHTIEDEKGNVVIDTLPIRVLDVTDPVSGMKRKSYLVHPDLVGEVTEIKPLNIVDVYWAVNKDGINFLILRSVPLTPNAADNTYNTSFKAVIFEAKSTWVRIATNQVKKIYRAFPAEKPDELGEPKFWERYDLWDLIVLAFKDANIGSISDPIMLELRGRKLPG